MPVLPSKFPWPYFRLSVDNGCAQILGIETEEAIAVGLALIRTAVLRPPLN